MDKQELNELIKELEDLQIRQETIIKKIRRASTEETPQRSVDQSAPSSSQQDSDTENFIRVGQRVLIKNRLGHIPIGRSSSIKDRAGTVTKVTKKRVQVKTYNGAETSRAPHNLTRLSQKEYEDIIKNA